MSCFQRQAERGSLAVQDPTGWGAPQTLVRRLGRRRQGGVEPLPLEAIGRMHGAWRV